MKIRNQFITIITLFLLELPTFAFARAGLGELDDITALIVTITVILATFLLPFGLNGSWVYDWYFAWFQLPLILFIVALVAGKLYKKKSARRTYFLVLLPLYALLTFTTNMLATAGYFNADHSDYFPQGRLIDTLFDRRRQQEIPTETEIRQYLGEPFAAASFSASSSSLPKEMEEYMRRSHLEKSYVLAYFEKSRGRKGMEERTYYILLDSKTRRYVTRSAYYGSSAVSDKWPHRLGSMQAP